MAINHQASSGLVKRYSIRLTAIGVFLAAVAFILLSEEDERYTELDPFPVTKASVLEAIPYGYKVPVNLVGVTQSRWKTKISSALEGTLVSAVDTLEPGTRITKGQVLIQLAKHAYQADFDAALSRVANTELALVKTRYEQQVALQMGGKLNTKFSRFEPQIALAEAEVRAAKSQLANAKQRLADTEITAPFDAIILQRNVTPAQKVQVSEPLLTIAAMDELDVQVSLSQRQWHTLVANDALLADNQLALEANIILENGQTVPLTLRYFEPLRDPVSRQYTLVFTLKGAFAETGLLPEQQVSLVVTSVKQVMAYALPASVLTEDGQIWLLDDEGLIKPVTVELLAQQGKLIWVKFTAAEIDASNTDNALLESAPVNILRYPMSHYIAGQEIDPVYDADAPGPNFADSGADDTQVRQK